VLYNVYTFFIFNSSFFNIALKVCFSTKTLSVDKILLGVFLGTRQMQIVYIIEFCGVRSDKEAQRVEFGISVGGPSCMHVSLL